MNVPTQEEVDRALDVLRAARNARILAMKRARRSALAKLPRLPQRFPTAAFVCDWCGMPFLARVQRVRSGRRYCSESCRQMGYRARKRRAR